MCKKDRKKERERWRVAKLINIFFPFFYEKVSFKIHSSNVIVILTDVKKNPTFCVFKVYMLYCFVTFHFRNKSAVNYRIFACTQAYLFIAVL